MFKKLQCAIVIMCMLSYASAGTVSIGTATVRGDMRVDSYSITGNATLFDGSVVETGQASAVLRLDKGTEITMADNSRGTLYRDHLVLQVGKTELAASSSFQLEANGLRVIPNEPNSRGVVSLRAGNIVDVGALTGGFGVMNAKGIQLASIHPGRAISFAIHDAGADPPGESSTSFYGLGIVVYENGQYYLDADTGTRYQITCKDMKKFVGMKVGVIGKVQGRAAPAGGTNTISIVCASAVGVNTPNGPYFGPYAGGIGTKDSFLIVGGVAAAIAGALIAVNETGGPSTPASR